MRGEKAGDHTWEPKRDAVESLGKIINERGVGTRGAMLEPVIKIALCRRINTGGTFVEINNGNS